MSAVKRQVSRLAKLLDKRMQELGMTQQEVADIVGFKNRNMLTIIKNGDGKLALERVPAMAKALKVEPRFLFRLALEQTYSNEIVQAIIGMIETSYSENERRIIDHIRKVTDEADPVLTPELEERLTLAFS